MRWISSILFSVELMQLSREALNDSRTQPGGVSDKASGMSTTDTQSGGAQEEDVISEEPMGPPSTLWDSDPITYLLR